MTKRGGGFVAGVGALLTAVVLVLSAASAHGQSLTAVRGLGYPLLPIDARSQILGGLGIGLQGFAAPLTNPAAAAGLVRRGALVTLTAAQHDLALGDATDEIGTSRFPLIQLLFPVGDLVLTAGYGGFLDQSWGVVREGEEMLGTEPIGYRDAVESTGGIGQFQLGAALPIGDRLALGAGLGLHLGRQRIRYTRTFDTASVAMLDPFTEDASWRYSGPMVQLGARWDPVDPVRIGVRVAWAATLSADSTAGRARSREIDLPLRVAAGASAYLAPGLLAAVSGEWSGWGVMEGGPGLPFTGTLPAGQDTWQVGGGLEWDNPESRSPRHYPLRLGVRYRTLPFALGGEQPTEWMAGAGLGMRVGADPENPVARVDLTMERGGRTAPGGDTFDELTERVWQLSVSIALFGT